MEWAQKILLWLYGFAALAVVWYAIEAMIDGWSWFRRKQRGVEIVRTLLKLLVAWFVAWAVVQVGLLLGG